MLGVLLKKLWKLMAETSIFLQLEPKEKVRLMLEVQNRTLADEMGLYPTRAVHTAYKDLWQRSLN